jgi:hypothetical protein
MESRLRIVRRVVLSVLQAAVSRSTSGFTIKTFPPFPEQLETTKTTAVSQQSAAIRDDNIVFIWLQSYTENLKIALNNHKFLPLTSYLSPLFITFAQF